jgi:copper chaperone
MEPRFEVENLKCGGCARMIEKAPLSDVRVTRIAVDPSRSLVVVGTAAELQAEVAATLARLGHPEKSSVEGLGSAAAVAKSFVSCAIGRLAD